jgi:hypothetical protein
LASAFSSGQNDFQPRRSPIPTIDAAKFRAVLYSLESHAPRKKLDFDPIQPNQIKV